MSLLNQKVIQIPDAYRSKYYFTGKSVGNSYFAVSKNVESMIGIYSYDVPANKLELNKEIKYLDFRELRDLAVEFVLKDKVIFYNSDNSGEKVYSFTNGSVNLLLSSKEEIVDFEFH